MNCPKCNKEVSPDWKLCPFCGFEPKRCSNPNHAPRWLKQEAKFCPDCGKVLEDTTAAPIPEPEEVSRTVSVGDILCTDNTTVPSSAWPVAGKTAIGVVFYVDGTGKHGWAVHLQDQGEHTWTPEGKESKVYGLHNCDTDEFEFADMEDGYANTKAIRAAGNTSVYPAAYAVDFEGGWCLPALGQLNVLVDWKGTINVILKKIDGGIDLNDGFYWSSTQYSKDSAWAVLYDEGYKSVFHNSKSGICRVRSVRDF